MIQKTYLITGAGSGIGAAISLLLAQKHTLLILHTKQNQTGLEQLAKQCQKQGAQVLCQYGDLADKSTVERLYQTVQQHSNYLSGLICNAGFPDWRAFESLDNQGLTDSYQVIVDATFSLLTLCTPLLLNSQQSTNRAGKVIAVSSFLAHKFKVGNNIVPASSMAKAALEALIKSYAAQYAHQQLTANIIVPGYIKKNAPDHQPLSEQSMQTILDRIPAGRLGQPSEVAELCEFLLSDKAHYITGQLIHIDGGLLLA